MLSVTKSGRSIAGRHDRTQTLKNTVDHVVTEYGVAELRGRSISERSKALIGIAHPQFPDDPERDAKGLGYL